MKLKPILLYLWKNLFYIAGCTIVGFVVFAPDTLRNLFYSITNRQAQFCRTLEEYDPHSAYQYIKRGFPTCTPRTIVDPHDQILSESRPPYIVNWPLARAADRDPAILSFLIRNGADVNRRDSFGYSALHYASNYGTCKALLDAGAKVNALGGINATPLDVVDSYNLEVIILLIEHGGRKCLGYVNNRSKLSDNVDIPIPDYTIKTDSTEFKKFLKTYQSNPRYNRLMSLPETACDLISRRLSNSYKGLRDDDRVYIDKLLDYHPELNRPDPSNGLTLFMKLCYSSKPQSCLNGAEDRLISKAIQYGAKVNLINAKDGRTALHYATEKNCVPIVISLLNHGADPNIKDKQGRLPKDLVSGIEVYLK
jgi:ankyrin repeat protein